MRDLVESRLEYILYLVFVLLLIHCYVLPIN